MTNKKVNLVIAGGFLMYGAIIVLAYTNYMYDWVDKVKDKITRRHKSIED